MHEQTVGYERFRVMPLSGGNGLLLERRMGCTGHLHHVVKVDDWGLEWIAVRCVHDGAACPIHEAPCTACHGSGGSIDGDDDETCDECRGTGLAR